MITRLSAKFPTLTAAFFYAIPVLLAFNKFFAGLVVLAPNSDQRGGYPPRLFAAEYFKEFGSLPEWSPYLFGGFPFVANTGFGDTFFPTALLRLIVPVDQGITLGFMVFVFLAGLFAFLFLRSLRLRWGSAFVGGAAYMFSGMILSMVSPGHDGKLFVSAMLPLALMFLYGAARLGDWRQYLYFGVTVGFCLLSPHFQATYYLLMASGFFWFFMIFLSKEKAEKETWWRASLLFTAALLVGFLIAAVQFLPFLEYMGFTSRGTARASAEAWGYATSYALPPEEVVGAILPGFNGSDIDHYFGRNFFKLHSDYVGVVAVLLALASFRLAEKRRLAWFFVFLIVYAALFAFGAHTPFYGIPYTLLPGISKTRAPSIILFLASVSVATLAAFGTEYLLSRSSEAGARTKIAVKKATAGGVSLLQQIDTRILYASVALVVIALLAVSGALQPLTQSLANLSGDVPAHVGRTKAADANYPLFVRHICLALILASGAIAVTLPSVARKMGRETAALLLGLIVLLDLWAVERSYVRFSERASVVFAADEVVSVLKADTTLHRVMPMPQLYEGFPNPYTANYFMGHRVRTVLGYNGFEMQNYDLLLGGKNSWEQGPWQSTIMSPKLWQLLGVKYVVVPAPGYPQADSLPDQSLRPFFTNFWSGLTPTGEALTTYDGGKALVYRVTNPLPYAFLVSSALRVDVGIDTLIATVLSPQFDARGLLLIPKNSPAGSDSIAGLATPVANAVRSSEERPGKLHFDLERPADSDAFLYIAENYYPGWNATVDGAHADVVRAQVSLMAVPIKAGAKSVDLVFSLDSYHRGRIISLVTLVAVFIIATLAWVQARRQHAKV